MKKVICVMSILMISNLQAILSPSLAMYGVGTAEYLEMVGTLLPNGSCCSPARSSSTSRPSNLHSSSIKTQDAPGCLDTFTSCFTSVFSCFKSRAGQAQSQPKRKRITKR